MSNIVSLERPPGRPKKWRTAAEASEMTGFSAKSIERWMDLGYVKTKNVQGERNVHMDTIISRLGLPDTWWTPTRAMRETGLSRSTVYYKMRNDQIIYGETVQGKTLVWPNSLTVKEEEDRRALLEEARTDDRAVTHQGGNGRLYWLHRLMREAPGFAEDWVNGKYPDVASAVRAAGLRD